MKYLLILTLQGFGVALVSAPVAKLNGNDDVPLGPAQAPPTLSVRVLVPSAGEVPAKEVLTVMVVVVRADTRPTKPVTVEPSA